MTDNAHRIAHALHTITTCWDDMLPNGPRLHTAGTIGRSGNRVLPVPAHILDTRATICATLAHYANYAIQHRNLNPGTLLHDDAVALATFLKPHATWLADTAEGDEAADTLATYAQKIDRIVDPTPPAQFVGPCPDCGHDLRAREGTATCQGCKNKYDAAEAQARTLEAVRDHIMPAYEIITVAPRLWPHHTLTKVHISRWSTRGDLTPAGQVLCDDGHYRNGYRVRDIETLVNRHHERKRA